jgi:tetratricopeptide (TPR) repeat protein
VVLHSFFDFLFHIPANLILFAVVLGLGYRVVHLKDAQNLHPVLGVSFKLSKYFKLGLIVTVCFVFLSLNILVLSRYQAEASFNKIKAIAQNSEELEAISGYRKALKNINIAISLNPLNSRYYDKKANMLLEILLREDLKPALSVFNEFNDPNRLKSLIKECLITAVYFNPTNAQLHVNLGRFYGDVLGDIDLKNKEFNRARLLDPQNKKLIEYTQGN